MKRLWLAIGLTFVLAVGVDVVLGRDLPGFEAAYGLVGCVVIIVVSKWLGRVWLQRPDDYYSQGLRDG